MSAYRDLLESYLEYISNGSSMSFEMFKMLRNMHD